LILGCCNSYAIAIVSHHGVLITACAISRRHVTRLSARRSIKQQGKHRNSCFENDRRGARHAMPAITALKVTLPN
jgi:hypothetical protein